MVMATARKSNFLYFESVEKTNPLNSDHPQFEFDESEVWSSNEVVNFETHQLKKKTFPWKKPSRKGEIGLGPIAGTSLPVKIPDWSRIICDDYKAHRKEEKEEVMEGDDEESNDWLPPHEYLARIRGSSLSVHEGIGRTLKGRDMSRVRNAVWKHIGFED